MDLYDENGHETEEIASPEIQNQDYVIGTDSITTESDYDNKGNLVAELDANGVKTAYAYDDSSRVTEVTQNASAESSADKRTVQTTYSAGSDASADTDTDTDTGTDADAGTDADTSTDTASDSNTGTDTETTVTTDALGHKTVEVEDAAGLVLSSTNNGDTEEESITTTNDYDSNGNKTKETFENGDYKEYTYDPNNLLTTTKYFEGDGTQTLESDDTYDELNRLTEMTDSKMVNGTLVPYRYTKYGYDAFGRMAWFAEVNSSSEPSADLLAKHKITYTYDAEDKVTGVDCAMPSAAGVQGLRFTYDSNRWLQKITAIVKSGTATAERTLRTYTYDTNGKASVITEYPGFAGSTPTANAVTKTYQYDAFDRMSSMTYKKGSDLLESYQYKYDKNANIIEKTEVNNTPSKAADHINHTIDYTYDSFGELTKSVTVDHNAQDKKTTVQYDYDKAGNRLKKTVSVLTSASATPSTETTVSNYNGLNQLLASVTTKDGKQTSNITYDYDMNGNQTSETDSVTSKSTVNEYDVDNRLSKATITQPGTTAGTTKSSVQEDQYNGNGQRTEKTVNGKSTDYYYQDGAESYTTETNAGTETKVQQNLLDTSRDIINQEQAASTGTNAYYLYDTDIQGSTTSLLNASGTGELMYTYDDFGETTVTGTSSSKNEICYTGGIYDADTGLYYLNARYYDPDDSQMITIDDASYGDNTDALSLNLYAYCENDPVNNSDPSGHYSRKNAVKYAHKWAYGRNEKYYSYSTDCANFVSQCLAAGGIHMNKTWHSYRYKKTYWYNPAAWFGNNQRYNWNVTEAWRLARKNYSYFYGTIRYGRAIKATKSSLKSVIQNTPYIRAGDLLYFAGKNGIVHHATLISKVDKKKGKLFYCAHTESRNDKDLSSKIGNEIVKIIRIKNKAS